MSEEKKPSRSISFGNAGRDNVLIEGNQITGDGANVNTGSGTLNVGEQHFTRTPMTAVEYVEKIEELLAQVVKENEAAIPPTVKSAVPDTELFPELKKAAAEEAPAVAATAESTDVTPAPKAEHVSIFGRFRKLVEDYGPTVGKALAMAAKKGIQRQVFDHPIAKLVQDFISELDKK